MKARKKPVVINFFEWTGDYAAFGEWVLSLGSFRGGFSLDPAARRLFVDTLEGQMAAEPGDIIIRGVKGEFYPCKPDIFAATYDIVEESGA